MSYLTGPDRRLGLLCAFLVGMCILATYPVLEMGTNDDWSYARTSLDLLRTGHLVYNGWATAMLGWQAYWGAFFIKLFGFSFLAVRLSTLPLAMGAAYIQYLILRWFGISRRNALLGTLTVVLSPVFLPVATSFMTDVPGFFCILLSFYACLRALDSTSAKAAILWLIFATVISVGGGTARQIVWLGALVMVPSTGWLLRQKRGMFLTIVALWVGSLIAVLGFLHWYQQQPYAIPEKFLGETFSWGAAATALQQARGTFFTLLLMSLPVLVAYLTRVSISKKLFLAFFVGLLLLLSIRAHGSHSLPLAPWLPNMITEYGVLGSGVLENLGVKPIVLPEFVRALLTLAILGAAAACFSAIAAFRSLQQRVTAPQAVPSWAVIFTLIGPFAVAYLLLLLPRAALVVTVDRYLIPLAAILLIPLLRYFQDYVHPSVSNLSFAVLTLFSAFAVASTHDYFATNRARFEAASEIHSAGVPRTAIQGGWEYDSWTQLQEVGYINDWRLENPPGAFHKPAPSSLPEPCRYWFSENTSAVTPRYFVVFSPMSCLAPSSFAPVRYHAWLPPFVRRIEVQQLPSNLSALSR